MMNKQGQNLPSYPSAWLGGQVTQVKGAGPGPAQGRGHALVLPAVMHAQQTMAVITELQA